MVKFTVITCTFNAETELPATLHSILEQRYRHVEHLIIDGVSHDRTVDIAADYKKRSAEAQTGHTIRILSEADKGLYDAMNKGMRLATGDYLVYLNAGDSFPEPDTLAHISRSVKDAEKLPGVLYGDTNIVDCKGRFLRHRRLAPRQGLNWRSFKAGMSVCHQAFYARTDLARCHPYRLCYRYSADVDWCINVMKEAERRGLELRNVHAVIANFQDGGMTTKNHRASLKERFVIMKNHYGWASTIGLHLWFVLRRFLKQTIAVE